MVVDAYFKQVCVPYGGGCLFQTGVCVTYGGGCLFQTGVRTIWWWMPISNRCVPYGGGCLFQTGVRTIWWRMPISNRCVPYGVLVALGSHNNGLPGSVLDTKQASLMQSWCRRVFFLNACLLFEVKRNPLKTTHPPSPPSSASTRTKRVPICSFLNFASSCILIKAWNWIVAELWGKIWDAGVHAHMTYQAPTTG